MVMQQSTPAPVPGRKFQFVGGALCLDFTNTVGGHRRGTAREFIGSFGEWLSWNQQAGLIGSGEAAALMKTAASHPEEAATVLARALGLREVIYTIFEAFALDKRPADPAVEGLNEELARASGKMAVASEGKDFVLRWQGTGDSLSGALGP